MEKSNNQSELRINRSSSLRHGGIGPIWNSIDLIGRKHRSLTEIYQSACRGSETGLKKFNALKTKMSFKKKFWRNLSHACVKSFCVFLLSTNRALNSASFTINLHKTLSKLLISQVYRTLVGNDSDIGRTTLVICESGIRLTKATNLPNLD